MNILWFEFTLALRRLARRRTQNGLMLVTFTVSVVLSLLSWSLFYTMFVRQPDFDPQGHYYVMSYAGALAQSSGHSTREEMEAYAAGQTVFADFAPMGFYLSESIRTPQGDERCLAAYPSARVLQIVGAKPLLGRLFLPKEDKVGSGRSVLLSQHLWANSFGSDPHIVGKTILVTGDPATVVGVMPANFRFPNDQDLWISYGSMFNNVHYPLRDALVQLKPGITRVQAERQLQVILTRLGPDSTENQRGLRPALLTFRQFYLLPNIRVSAMILLALSLVFVVVSCANAANLMLIDFLGRRSEVATALALGIPRGAAIRSIGYQVLVNAAAAALLSLALLPVAGPMLFDHIKIITAPYWLNYHFAWNYVGVAFALAGVAAAVTIIAPLVYLWWVHPDRVIREHAYASRETGRTVWRRVILVGQIALLTVLGVSAALLVRSSYHVGRSRWGYPAGRVFMGKISALAIDFPRGQQQFGWLKTHLHVLQQVERRPETAAAAFTDNGIGYSNGPYCRYALDPATLNKQGELGEAFYARATEGYFDTLDVPFVAGKMFPKENSGDGPTYAVINETLAEKLWPKQDPLQRALYVHYRWMDDKTPPVQLTICGVVRNFQPNGPTAKTNDCIITPFLANYGGPATAFLLVRDWGGIPTFRSLDAAVHRADLRVSLYFPSTIKGQIDLMLSAVRMTTGLTTVFAIAAMLLCGIGIYSLAVTQVLQSSHEFGIRMALGAMPGRLWRHFVGGHLAASLLGVAIGLVGAMELMRVLGALLYGVDPHNAVTYGGIALLILLVSVLACIPSLFRLQRIHPAECLRSL